MSLEHTYIEKCIHRGLFSSYEEEARENVNNAQAREYCIECLHPFAHVLMGEDIIKSTFFNNYMSDLDELEKCRVERRPFEPRFEPFWHIEGPKRS